MVLLSPRSVSSVMRRAERLVKVVAEVVGEKEGGGG